MLILVCRPPSVVWHWADTDSSDYSWYSQQLLPVQVSGAGARVRWGAVRLPGEERSVNAQRGQKVLQTDHLGPGLLPQPLHMVCSLEFISRLLHITYKRFSRNSSQNKNSKSERYLWTNLTVCFNSTQQAYFVASCSFGGLLLEPLTAAQVHRVSGWWWFPLVW